MHGPHERAVALLVDPGVVVVGDPDAVEAGGLGEPCLPDELLRSELLAGEEVADAHGGGPTRFALGRPRAWRRRPRVSSACAPTSRPMP